MPDVSIIIVNWNSKDYVRRCLASVYAHCQDLAAEFIVVDGGSFDGCAEMLAAEFPAVRFIQSPTNVGFAKANNLGVRQATGRHLLFLNPDTELHEDSVRILIGQLGSLPQAGAVGCRLLNADGSLQTNCVQAFPTVLNQVVNSEYMRRKFPNWRIWGINPLFSDPPRPAQVEVLCGACILTTREIFQSVGGFSEDYFMYGEDHDLCFKIRRAGWRVYFTPATSIVHFGGGSTQKSAGNFANVMMRESVYRFLQLNRGRASALAFRLAISLASVFRLILILILLPFSRNQVVRHGTGSLKKWFSILRWGLGLEPWVHTYPRSRRRHDVDPGGWPVYVPPPE